MQFPRKRKLVGGGLVAVIAIMLFSNILVLNGPASYHAQVELAAGLASFESGLKSESEPSYQNGDSPFGIAVNGTACGPCGADTTGPCRHFTSLCFAVLDSGKCPLHTSLCGTERQGADSQQLATQLISTVGGTQLPWRPPAGSPYSDGLVIVTAASVNHACPLLNMLTSLAAVAPETAVIVYDLDPTPPLLDKELLRFVHPNVLEVRQFDYAAHPSYFSIDKAAGEYAWKPSIIKATTDEFGEVLWVDSGNIMLRDLFDPVKISRDLIGPNGFWSPTSQDSPWQWAHLGMFMHYGMRKCCARPGSAGSIMPGRKKLHMPCCCCDPSPVEGCTECGGDDLEPVSADIWMKKHNCNGALMGFRKNSNGYEKILVPWVNCAFDKECIAPSGPGVQSTRENHRQDQASLSILADRAGMPCTTGYGKLHKRQGVMLHQDNRKTNTTKCREIRAAALAGILPPSRNQPTQSPNPPRSRTIRSEDQQNQAHQALPHGKPSSQPGYSQSNTDETVEKGKWKPWPHQRQDVLTQKCSDDQLQAHPSRKFEDLHSTETHFTHVINPFPSGDDVHFSFSLPAIEKAYARAVVAGIRVQVIAIYFEHEHANLVLPSFIERYPVIPKSRAAGEYLQRERRIDFGTKEKPLKGPIVSDVWQAMYDFAKADMVIWSNFDLIVAPEFYERLFSYFSDSVKTLQLPSLLGVSLLRRDVLIPVAKFDTIADWSSERVFSWNYSTPQAGHDCMVLPRRWIPCLEIQGIVFGVGGWDHSVYSQFKHMAYLEQGQFRTLGPNHELPKLGLTAHVGSQIANPKRWFTNPVSWKGVSREVQYAFNKKAKGEVEVFLGHIRGPKHMCKRPELQPCQDNGISSGELGVSLVNDWRLLALAVATPSQAGPVTELLQLLTGTKVASMYDTTLTVDQRNSALALVTHALDTYPGPKPADVFESQPIPPGKKRGREKGRVVEVRSAVLLIDNPVAVLCSWMDASKDFGTGMDWSTSIADGLLRKYIDHYVSFWTYWLDKVETSVLPVALLNLTTGQNRAAIGREMAFLHGFLAYNRCTTKDKYLCRSKSPSHGICCAVEHATGGLASAVSGGAGAEAVAKFPTEVVKKIHDATREVTERAAAAWKRAQAKFQWPNVMQCCG